MARNRINPTVRLFNTVAAQSPHRADDMKVLGYIRKNLWTVLQSNKIEQVLPPLVTLSKFVDGITDKLDERGLTLAALSREQRAVVEMAHSMRVSIDKRFTLLAQKESLGLAGDDLKEYKANRMWAFANPIKTEVVASKDGSRYDDLVLGSQKADDDGGNNWAALVASGKGAGFPFGQTVVTGGNADVEVQ